MSTKKLAKINDKYNRDTNAYNSILPFEEVHINPDSIFFGNNTNRMHRILIQRRVVIVQ